MTGLSHFPAHCSTVEASSRFSGFLFAKLVNKPQDPDAVCRAYLEKLSQPPLESPIFKSALTNFIIPCFRRGWDCMYNDTVLRHTLSDKSCVELSSTAEWDLSYREYVEMAVGDRDLPRFAISELKKRQLLAIEDSGKLRLITKASKWQHLLAPLHRVIYGVLTGKTFGSGGSPVLRGEARPSSFDCFPFADDTEVVSGDYEASTDNLSSVHALHILRELRRTSLHVPDQIWDLAESSLTGEILYKSKSGFKTVSTQRTGQLMGNFLSFPLLCISNLGTLFCAFGSESAWSLIYSGLVRVNGDDIVWCAWKGAHQQWVDSLHHSGFILNPTKTSVHKKFFTLNSKLFKRGTRFVKKVWHLIPKGVFKKTDPAQNSDLMAAHAAIVRENIRGAPGSVRARVCRALASVKLNAWRQTRVKSLVGSSKLEYQSYPAAWKTMERLCEFERRFSPLKERYRVPLVGVERIGISKATLEESLAAPYLSASISFSAQVKRVEKVSNDRFVDLREWKRCVDWLFLAEPQYQWVREEEEIWICKRTVPFL
jgi:hypothetical protein